jgi:hypothetical protein
MRAGNPLRLLALAVVKQAMLDYRNGADVQRESAVGFLATGGKEILSALGFRPSLLDDFLANPGSFGSLRSEPCANRRKR